MPVAWARHDKRQIFLNVAIVDAAVMQSVQGGVALIPHVEMFKALIDTGATSTCITRETAAKISLTPVGKVAVQGVAGIQHHNNYLFYVGFLVQLGPGSIVPAGIPANASAGELHLMPTPIQGAEINSGGAFDVLLGMDVISTGSLKIEGDGTFSWAW
jgi:hypothetical protein